jgi:hypothetical protein
MSIWSDIHRRSNGHAHRTEDIVDYMNVWDDMPRFDPSTPTTTFIYDTSVINPNKVTDDGIRALRDTFVEMLIEEMIRSKVFGSKVFVFKK